MRKYWFLFIFSISMIGCSDQEKPTEASLVNTRHLEHLYEEVTVGDTTMGAIWIYCEAPDYHLVSDEDEGFTCVDDVARTLVFYCRQYANDPSQEILNKVRSLTEFLLFMQAENAYFYNFLLPGPEVNKTHQNSRAIANWWSWRAFWALSEMNLLTSPELSDLQDRSRPVMDTLIQKMETLCPSSDEQVFFDGVAVPACLSRIGADQLGTILIGLTNYYQIKPSAIIKSLLLSFGELLLDVQHGDADTWPHYAIMSWRNSWHAWGNSQAYALLYAGRILEHEPFIRAGLNEVQHFYPYVLDQGFVHGFKVIKEADSLLMQDYLVFPQIAYNIRPMVFASLEAFSITGDKDFAVLAARLASWFFGNNPANQIMYDVSTGRGFDGIGSPTEVNFNSGAESTVEALLSLQAIERVPEARELLEANSKRKG